MCLDCWRASRVSTTDRFDACSRERRPDARLLLGARPCRLQSGRRVRQGSSATTSPPRAAPAYNRFARLFRTRRCPRSRRISPPPRKTRNGPRPSLRRRAKRSCPSPTFRARQPGLPECRGYSGRQWPQARTREAAYFRWEQAGRPEGRADGFWRQAQHERFRERAYALWEREGRPEGKADEHWRRVRAFAES